MRKDKRTIYVELSNEADAQLCTFCKYSKRDGFCKKVDCDCQHPLDVVKEFTYMTILFPGDDCWGFRPLISVSDIADIVGIVLAEQFREWYWQLMDDNQIEVVGSKRAE